MNTSHTNPTSNASYFCNADTPLNELPRQLGLQSFAVVLEPLPHPAVFAQLRAALRLGRTRASLIADSLPIARSCTVPAAAAISPAPASTVPRQTPRPASTRRAAKAGPHRDPQRQFRFPTKAA